MKYLIGVLGQIDLFDQADSREEAEAIAERLCGPDQKVGIWELRQTGHREAFHWDRDKTANNGTAVRNYRTWTRGELETLRTLRSKGLTAKQIAAQLGRTETAVCNAASRYLAI